MKSIFSTLHWIIHFSHRRGGTRLWLLAALSLTSIFAFVELADEILESRSEMDGDDTLHYLDQVVWVGVEKIRHPILTQSMIDFTALGSMSVLGVVSFFALIFLALRKDRLAFLHYSITSVGALLLPHFLKLIIRRERPALLPHLATVTDTSFPSGHAFGATAIYLTLAFFMARYKKGLRYELFFLSLAIGLILTIGFSRIYLGVHYPTDIFAGFCTGGAWSFLVTLCFLPYYAPKNV